MTTGSPLGQNGGRQRQRGGGGGGRRGRGGGGYGDRKGRGRGSGGDRAWANQHVDASVLVLYNAAQPPITGLLGLLTGSGQHYGIYEIGGTALARALAEKPGLETLDLRGNALGDAAAAALAESLGGATRLAALRLDNNAIGDVGMKALAEPLKKATQLESLILGKNQIGDAGVAALAGALEGAGGLAPGVMRLNDNQFGDEGILALAAAFKTNEKKIRLHVANNTIGDEAMATITAVLRGRAPPKSDRGPMTPEQIAAMNARFKELGLDYEYGGKQHQQENKEENKEEL